MDERAHIEQSTEAIKELIEKLPTDTYRIKNEKAYEEIVQTDDYPILWQVELVPVSPNACPLALIVSSGDDGGLTYGFGFDTRAEIGKRLGLRVSSWSRHIIGFGTEPVHMSLEKVLQILSSVFEGRVALRWTAIGGILTSTAGDVTTAIGVETFRSPGGMLMGYFRGETFQYKPWNSVVATLKAEHS